MYSATKSTFIKLFILTAILIIGGFLLIYALTIHEVNQKYKKLQSSGGNVPVSTSSDLSKDYVSLSGSNPQEGNININGDISGNNVQGSTIASTVQNGTAPLNVASSTEVKNLNAEMVDGKHADELIKPTVNNITNTTTGETIQPGTTSEYYRGDKTWQTLNKSAVGLGNVENTALSTWGGTSSISTIGNVTSGTINSQTISPSANFTGTLTVASSITTADVITKGPIVDARSYGAVCDGTTNNTTAFSNAISAMSAGQVLFIPSGSCVGDITLTKSVKIKGNGMPDYDSTSGRLKNGTILIGYIDLNGQVGAAVSDLGVDQTTTTDSNGVTVSANPTSNLDVYQQISNVTVLGRGYASGSVHGFEIEATDSHIAHVDVHNVRAYKYDHGMSMKASYSNVSDAYFQDNDADSMIVKSDQYAGDAEHINISNVVANDTATGKSNGLANSLIIQSYDPGHNTRFINVNNFTSYNNGGDAIIVQQANTRAGVVQYVNLSNLTIQSPTGVGVRFFSADTAAVTDVTISNAQISGSGGFAISNESNKSTGLKVLSSVSDASANGTFDRLELNTTYNLSGSLSVGSLSSTGTLQGSNLSINNTADYAAYFQRGGVNELSIGITSGGQSITGANWLNIGGSGTNDTMIVKGDVGGIAIQGGETINTAVASNVGLIVKGYTSQIADLMQGQDSLGNVLFKVDSSGNLTVKSATFTGTLTMNGHIITGNSSGTTTIAAGANAGTGATASIVGNDTSGTIIVTTGTGPAVGVLATVTFANAYGAAPDVVIAPKTNGNGATLQYYTVPGTTTFTLNSNNAPAGSTTYTYSYMVMQ